MDIKFTGDGMKDISISKDSTMPPTGKSGGKSDGGISFTGDGMKDVSITSTNTSQHQPGSKQVPKGGGISFAGDGEMDVR